MDTHQGYAPPSEQQLVEEGLLAVETETGGGNPPHDVEDVSEPSISRAVIPFFMASTDDMMHTSPFTRRLFGFWMIVASVLDVLFVSFFVYLVVLTILMYGVESNFWGVIAMDVFILFWVALVIYSFRQMWFHCNQRHYRQAAAWSLVGPVLVILVEILSYT